MSFFCIHDWAVFRTSTRALNSSNDWIHYYDGVLISGDEHYEFITDDVCSKCQKLRLDLKKAIQWGEENKRRIARREEAIEWAQKYIGLTDKT